MFASHCSFRVKSIPRVSVLITTYNGASTVAQSIASILDQEMCDFELIIVDDGSTDDTPQLLASVVDRRVIILRNDERLGISGARNRGLAKCRGSYIAMLDHDDLSDPRRLALQSAYLDSHPDVVLVGSAVQELSERGVSPEDQPRHTSPPLLRFLLHLDNPLGWSSVMVRSDALRRLDPPPLRSRFEPADDFDLYHRLLEQGEIARLDIPLTTYRWHASNASHTSITQINEHATEVLTRAYAPWFGSEAAAAAALVVQYSNNRMAVSEPGTMSRLREIVMRVADGLSEARPSERPAIAAGAQLILWRLTRAAVRSGRLSLFRRPAPAVDAAASLAIGAIRAGLRRRSRHTR